MVFSMLCVIIRKDSIHKVWGSDYIKSRVKRFESTLIYSISEGRKCDDYQLTNFQTIDSSQNADGIETKYAICFSVGGPT